MTSQACVISRIMQSSTGSPTLTADTPEAPSCFVLLSSEFPDMLSRSKSISGADSPPKSATSAILRRLWGTPQNCALSTRQAILHPSPMTHPEVLHLPFGGSGITAFGSTILAISSRTRRKSSPLWLLKAPTTFSHTMYRGLAVPEADSLCSLISLTSRVCSKKRTDRFPSNPALDPAILTSWQGLPPMTQSTTGTSRPFIFVISPRCFVNSFSSQT